MKQSLALSRDSLLDSQGSLCTIVLQIAQVDIQIRSLRLRRGHRHVVSVNADFELALLTLSSIATLLDGNGS